MHLHTIEEAVQWNLDRNKSLRRHLMIHGFIVSVMWAIFLYSILFKNFQGGDLSWFLWVCLPLSMAGGFAVAAIKLWRELQSQHRFSVSPLSILDATANSTWTTTGLCDQALNQTRTWEAYADTCKCEGDGWRFKVVGDIEDDLKIVVSAYIYIREMTMLFREGRLVGIHTDVDIPAKNLTHADRTACEDILRKLEQLRQEFQPVQKVESYRGGDGETRQLRAAGATAASLLGSPALETDDDLVAEAATDEALPSRDPVHAHR